MAYEEPPSHYRDRIERATAGEMNADIARAIVQIYRSFRGRGPSKARALFRDDVLVVVLEDVMTPSERSLLMNGRGDDALALRRDVHDVMRPALTASVEALSGCGVRALVGESHSDPDVAVEVFLLSEPPGRPEARIADRVFAWDDDQPGAAPGT
jgi:uncharacterized protein YbcI